jgi:2-methylisocitrate lyase-like PEP mutase family enzyme
MAAHDPERQVIVANPDVRRIGSTDAFQPHRSLPPISDVHIGSGAESKFWNPPGAFGMAETRPSIAAKRRAFLQLHETGCFLIPNPWDVGTARYLQSLGFKALATTSSGFGWSKGRPDAVKPRDMALAHLHEIVSATDLPVNADFESGFAHDAAGVAESVRLAVEAGVAGLSIEDATGDAAKPLYDLGTAVERIRTARRAIDQAGGDALLVGRAECFLVGRPDLDETIGRLRAYSQAGADCLYAPGIRTRGQLTMQDISGLGVRRVSVGGALARTAWGAFMRASRLIAEQGKFDGFANAASSDELDSFFRDDLARRGSV